MTKHPRYHPQRGVSVGAQIAQMQAAHPSLKLATWHCGEARWVGRLRPTDVSITYAVTIAYRLRTRPRVFVTAPSLVRQPDAEIPHLHHDGSLCLHLPHEWNSTMSIAATIVPWATLWLYYYEMWHATGEWLGGGAHPRLRSAARRIAGAAQPCAVTSEGAA